MNLETPGTLKLISERLKKDIDDFCVRTYDTGPRSHLGASQIGHKCERYLWYQFRWVAHKTHSGRMYRLFQRGHLEENRFIEYLEGIGCKVTCFDENNLHEEDKGKRQIRIGGCNGHFGGSIDSIIELPEHYNVGKVLFLGEYKTNGTGRAFSELLESSVRFKKEQHWAQMCMYGYKLNLKYGIYMNVNKNDDDIHIEVVELDWKLGSELEKKAERVITANEPPERISKNSAYFECKYCDVFEVCWNEKSIDKNCRSCKMCLPVEDAQWKCSEFGIIPKKFIPTGCKNWFGIV